MQSILSSMIEEYLVESKVIKLFSAEKLADEAKFTIKFYNKNKAKELAEKISIRFRVDVTLEEETLTFSL